MRDTSFYEQILGLEKPWGVDRVKLDVEAQRVDLWLEHQRGARWKCPECEASCGVYDHSEERSWRHLDTCQFKTLIHARIPRVNCEKCGVRQVKVSWADPKSRFTLLMEALIVEVLEQTRSVKACCELTRIHWESCMRVMRRAVERGQQRKEQSVVKYLAVDEKAFRRGHSYLTIVCDAREGTVEWVSENRDRDSLVSYYQQLGEEQLEGIEAVAMDMWPAYISATLSELPGATDKIVFDRFHVMKMMNEALDKVRRQEAERLRRRGDPRLKQTRYLWLFGYENVPEEREEDFEALRESELKTARAWHIKETLRYLWDYRRIGWARKFFRKWYGWAIRSQLAPIRKVAKSLKAHEHNILTYCKHRITTGVAEGLNSKIMSIKRLAGGFRNMENFKTAIYFYCGGLDLHPR